MPRDAFYDRLSAAMAAIGSAQVCCTATHYSTLQHTATHCNTLKHTVTHCNTLQHTATHCNTLQHTAAHCNTLQHTATHCNSLQHIATHCNTLQHTSTHCNTLQHTATHYKKPRDAFNDRLSAAVAATGSAQVWYSKVYCCVLPCAAVYAVCFLTAFCSLQWLLLVLHGCAAVYCSVWQCLAVPYRFLQCPAVCCSELL